MLGLVFVVLIVIWLGVNFIQDPDEFGNIFLIGLTRGCVYALVALGYTLVYGILQLINFAHGDVFALSGLVASTVLLSWFNVTDDTAGSVVLVAVPVALVVAMAFAATLNTTVSALERRAKRQQ